MKFLNPFKHDDVLQFPFEMRRRRLTVILITVLVSILLAGVVLWALVYQAIISSTAVVDEVPVLESNFKLSWYGPSDALLQKPAGIAFDEQNNRVYVTDSDQARIFVFSADGTSLTSFTGGEDDLRLDRPTSIAVAEDGRVYVVDAGRGVLVVFDRRHVARDIIVFEPEQPMAVAIERSVDGDEQLWVATRSGLTLGTLDGTFSRGFYAWGGEVGQFDNPTALAARSVETSQTIFVCDSLNYRVQAFDFSFGELEPLWVYGAPLPVDDSQRYTGPSRKFDLPVSLTYLDNRVFVLDGMSSVIVVLDALTGEYITQFGGIGYSEGQMYFPTSIASGDDLLWVADQNNGRVTAFAPAETIPAESPIRPVFPVALLWILAQLLALVVLACLIRIATMRPTRLLFSLDALDTIDRKGTGADIAHIAEQLWVPFGAEALARQVFGADAVIFAVAESTTLKDSIEAVRSELSEVDFAALAAASSLRRVVVVGKRNLRETARNLGYSAVSVKRLMREVKADVVLS